MRQLLAFVFASGMALAQAPSTSPSMAFIGDNRDVANSVPVNDGDRLLADLLQHFAGQSSGQVLSYDAASRVLALRDGMAGEQAKFVLSPNASVLRVGK